MNYEMTPKQPLTYQQYDQKGSKDESGHIIIETPVSLTVNGEVWTTFMCTPIHVEALMTGFLFNEGVINSISEIADLRICEHGDNVDVWLTRNVTKPENWTRTSGCTGGVTAVELIEQPQPILAARNTLLTPHQINILVAMLFESQELYRETGGVHTSALSDGSRVILSAEDIGRHNTLDKLAGLWLMKNTPANASVLATTGRISSEMLQKAVRIGADILISRTSPSSLSIDLAHKWGITLIGYARRNQFRVFSSPQRIA